ncbi:hypothetical protein HW090_11815 [Pseudomonas sp. ABC1]|uniref:hypothetical protein n=1 Tax=Pseudomonas sp. ABC1 TaxID=2748080 RepID=UPI0015C2CC34|nr:hypothetical protein [Pseudomonas sp. ABC1]QLF93848.1 hypothetical protein HW090_11815 [Pseudomonas sp. ABC1]
MPNVSTQQASAFTGIHPESLVGRAVEVLGWIIDCSGRGLRADQTLGAMRVTRLD